MDCKLQNFIERAVIVSPGAVLRVPLESLRWSEQFTQVEPQTLAQGEYEHILRVLKETDWVVGGSTGAANKLGLKRTTLMGKIRRLGLSPQPRQGLHPARKVFSLKVLIQPQGIQNSCLGWASWSNFVSDDDYDIKGYTSPYWIEAEDSTVIAVALDQWEGGCQTVVREQIPFPHYCAHILSNLGSLDSMIILVTIIHVLVCLFLIIVVLLQSGKAGDISAAFGGQGSQAAFGPRGAATALSKATTISAVLFMLTSVTLSINAIKQGGPKSVLEGVKSAPVKTQPAAPAPVNPTQK